MSSLSICSMACMTPFDFFAFLSCKNLGKIEGTICHDSPYLSLSQPHRLVWPPADSLLQKWSTSSCVWQLTTNDMASLNLKSGPPFRAGESGASGSNEAVNTLPLGPGPASP